MTHVLVLDPARDLREAGECSCSQCERELFGRLRAAVEDLARDRGLEVRILAEPVPGEECPAGAECAVCHELWQAAHNIVGRSGWQPGAHDDEDDRVEEAAAYLDAVEVGGGMWRYYAHETGAWYRATRDDLEWLGALLRDDELDAYSLWCASTDARPEQEEGAP